MSKGYVYVLSNRSMPGVLKIGKTTQAPELRCKQLSDATGVPLPFEIEYYALVPDCNSAERWVHDELAELRCSPNREFFSVQIGDAVAKIHEILDEQLHELLDEFAPNTTFLEYDTFVDPGDVSHLAHRMDVQPQEIISAFYLITPEEYAPALQRWQDKVAARSLARLEGTVMPPLRPVE